MAANPSPVVQIERAWHRLMSTLAVKHANVANVGLYARRQMIRRMQGK